MKSLIANGSYRLLREGKLVGLMLADGGDGAHQLWALDGDQRWGEVGDTHELVRLSAELTGRDPFLALAFEKLGKDARIFVVAPVPVASGPSSPRPRRDRMELDPGSMSLTAGGELVGAVLTEPMSSGAMAERWVVRAGLRPLRIGQRLSLRVEAAPLRAEAVHRALVGRLGQGAEESLLVSRQQRSS
jgi:hypothetical protein